MIYTRCFMVISQTIHWKITVVVHKHVKYNWFPQQIEWYVFPRWGWQVIINDESMLVQVSAVRQKAITTWNQCWLPSIMPYVEINSLRPSDAIWRQRSWTTLVQVMACCLTAPSHHLNQCWHQQSLVTINWGLFQKRYPIHKLITLEWKSLVENFNKIQSTRLQWVKPQKLV